MVRCFAPPKRTAWNALQATDCKGKRPHDFLFYLLETTIPIDQIRAIAVNELTADPENAFARAWFGLRHAHSVFRGHKKEEIEFVIAMINALSESNNRCAGRVLAGAIRRYRHDERIVKELSGAIANVGESTHRRTLEHIISGERLQDSRYSEDLQLFLERYPDA